MPDLTHDDQEIVRKAIQCAHDNGLRIGRESAAEGVRLGIETATKAFAPVLDTIVKTFEKITDSNADTVRKAMSAFVDGSGGELVRPAGCIPKRRSKKRKKVLKGSFDMAPYGYCPECFAPGVVAERRLNGNAHCQNGHVYPRSEAEYASTQIDLTGGIRERLAEFSAQIADGDLIEDGRETDFHITAKFGLHYSDATMVSAIVADFGPVNYYVSDFASFQNDEYDVLYARVESDDLYRLNAKLSELCCTTTHPTYTPHATVAYLKPGLADKYIRRFGGISLRGTADTLTFSSPSREETKIPLGGTPLGAVAKAVVETDDEAEPDPMDALTQAVVEEVYAAREQGDEDAVQAVIERYRGMIDDPALLEGHAGGVVKKGWSESDHPRSKTGQFIAKDDLKEAQTNPEKAKELREKVRPEDADKLEAVISGEKNPGRTKRGEQRHQAGQRREKKAANLKRANEIADKIAGGEGTAEDHHELADHLEGLTLDQLGILRSKIATRSGGRKKADVVGRLRDALRTGQSQAAVQRETPKDHARLAMSGFQPNRHDVADSNGEKVKAGTGYVRYEDGRSVGYSADDAERMASAVTPEDALARIDMHDNASKDEAMDPMLRDYHAELADQLRGHHEATFGGKENSTPPPMSTPELKPSHPTPDEKSVTRQAWAANQLRKRQGKPPVDHELKLVPLDSVKPSQHGEDYINDSSKELARKVAGGKRSDRQQDNDPIALDESGNIVDGNHRHAAATMNGEKSIWAIVPKQPSITPRLGPPGGGENSNEGAAFDERKKLGSELLAKDRRQQNELVASNVGKYPHEMTREQFREHAYNSEQEFNPNVYKRRTYKQAVDETVAAGGSPDDVTAAFGHDSQHRRIVESALSAGKPVPPEVLADYPEIAKKYAPKASSSPKKPDQLPGGQADNAPDAAFSTDKLAEGQKHEGEHTTDPALAKEIAKDHLAEDPAYYDKLAKVEGGSADSQRGTPNTTGAGGAKEPHEMTPTKPDKHVTRILTALAHDSPVKMEDASHPEYQSAYQASETARDRVRSRMSAVNNAWRAMYDPHGEAANAVPDGQSAGRHFEKILDQSASGGKLPNNVLFGAEDGSLMSPKKNSYDIPPDVIKRVKRLAVEQGVPVIPIRVMDKDGNGVKGYAAVASPVVFGTGDNVGATLLGRHLDLNGGAIFESTAFPKDYKNPLAKPFDDVADRGRLTATMDEYAKINQTPEVLADYPDLAAKYGPKAEAKPKKKPAAPPPEPQHGKPGSSHPLAGKSRDEQVQHLAETRARLDSGEEDPLGVHTGPPTGLDMGSFREDVTGVVGRHAAELGGVGMDLTDLYGTVGKKYGLNKHDFLRAVHSLHDDYIEHGSGHTPFRLTSPARGPDSLDDPELAGTIGSQLSTGIAPTADNHAEMAQRGDRSLNTSHPAVQNRYGGQNASPLPSPKPQQAPAVASNTGPSIADQIAAIDKRLAEVNGDDPDATADQQRQMMRLMNEKSKLADQQKRSESAKPSAAATSDPLTPHIDRLAPLIEMGQHRVITTELAQKATAELEKMPQSQVAELANRLLPNGFTGKRKSDAIYAIRKRMLTANQGYAGADDWDNWGKDQVTEMPTVSEEDKARYREKHAAKTPAVEVPAAPAPSTAPKKPKAAPKPKEAVNEAVVNEHADRLAPLVERAKGERFSQEFVDETVKSVEHLPKEELRAIASKITGVGQQFIKTKQQALNDIRGKLTPLQRYDDSQLA